MAAAVVAVLCPAAHEDECWLAVDLFDAAFAPSVSINSIRISVVLRVECP